MAECRQYIAVDLGAESGRVVLAWIGDREMKLVEAHRFPNGPVRENDSIRWDFNRLMSEIRTGIGKAVALSDKPVSGIGIDSWGVDFGLIGPDGALLENPYHYRDSRTDGMMEKAFELMPRREVYGHTGIQFMQFNSVYQLLAMRLANSKSLCQAAKVVFIADLVGYYLCGAIFSEYTLASTSQLMDMKTGTWSVPVFDRLGLRTGLMPEIVPAGTVVGCLKDEIASELQIDPIPVIAAGSHDTACAVAGVPVSGKNWAYISSGTWSLVGLEVPDAIINDKTYQYCFTNEGGIDHTIRLLKNVMGLWLVQECRRQWLGDGDALSYEDLTELARQSKPFVAHVDPDYHEFLAPGSMPAKINRYLESTGQQPVNDKGQMVRIILESLALRYRWVLDRLEEVRGQQIEHVHVVGGGIKNELLCQFTADSTGRDVIAGPAEATAAGNAVVQAWAAGQIPSLSRGRDIIRNSFELKSYSPQNTGSWDRQYEKLADKW